MIDLQRHADGIILPVRAQPGARNSDIRGLQSGALKVSVTQAPEQGKANKAVADLLAKRLGLRRSQIELLSGATSQNKRFLIRQWSADQLRARLRDLLPDEDWE